MQLSTEVHVSILYFKQEVKDLTPTNILEGSSRALTSFSIFVLFVFKMLLSML